MPTQRHEEKRVGERSSLREGEREGERERESVGFGSSFYMFFFLPLGLPYVNWASQEICLFYLKSSLRSLDHPLTFLCSIFAGFSFPYLLATTVLYSCFLF